VFAAFFQPYLVVSRPRRLLENLTQNPQAPRLTETKENSQNPKAGLLVVYDYGGMESAKIMCFLMYHQRKLKRNKNIFDGSRKK